MKWTCLLALSALLLLNCQNVGDSTADANATPGVPDDLPVPANETVEMLLNGARHTLTNKFSCKNNTAGLGFAMAGGGNPTLFLHGADLAATGNITIRTGSNPLAWHMDIDETATWGTVAAGCNAVVVENSATIFELKTVACNIKDQFGPNTGKVSFRVRCTKGT